MDLLDSPLQSPYAIITTNDGDIESTTPMVVHKKTPASLPRVTPRDLVKRRRKVLWRKWSVRLLGFLYHLSITILITTMPELLLLGSRNNFSKTASFLGMCSGIERALQFFSMPFMGKLSDAYGRKPVLLVSLLGHLCSLIMLATMPSAVTILVYYAVNGAMNATMAVTTTMVIDWTLASTPGEGKLAQQYGRFGMAVGLSLIIGPAVGPSLSTINVLLPLWVSLGCVAACLLLWFYMEESLSQEARVSFSMREANPFRNIVQACKNRNFLLFITPFFITQVAESIYHFMILYTRKRFQWSFVELGMYVAAMGVAIAIVQGNLKYLVPKYLSESRCITFGLAAHTLSLIIISFSNKDWMLVLVVLPQMVASLKQPGLMSLMSGTAPASEQGILQGSIQSIRVVAKAIGSPAFGALLSYSMREQVIAQHGPAVQGLPFLLGGIMEALSLLIAMWVINHCTNPLPNDMKPTPEPTSLVELQTISPSSITDDEGDDRSTETANRGGHEN